MLVDTVFHLLGVGHNILAAATVINQHQGLLLILKKLPALGNSSGEGNFAERIAITASATCCALG